LNEEILSNSGEEEQLSFGGLRGITL